MRRRLEIDVSELDTALNYTMPECTHFLDLETGAVILITDDTRGTLEELYDEAGNETASIQDLLAQREDIRDWQKQALLEAEQVDLGFGVRYIRIEPDDPRQDYRVMERFIDTLDDDDLREQLWRAIQGRGAFRYFRDVVARYPDLQAQWYAYKDAQAEARVRQWLEDRDIEPVS